MADVGREARDRTGKWTRVKPLYASDLSTPDARRSPEVSDAQFQAHAKRGAVKYAALGQKAEGAMALDGARFKRITDDAYAASREPWGGVTVDSHTGEHVAVDADAYALSIRKQATDSVQVDPAASREDFDNAMDTARKRFAQELEFPGAHLGVFHDDDLKQIDIDPVLVTPSLEDVHDIGAYTRATGGAYHFKSGDGFWPPHVKGNDMAKKNKTVSLAIQTPTLHNAEFDLAASKDGRLAYWKQILPMRTIHYTAKDGSRQKMDFTQEYLEGLASATAVDSLGFLLADQSNRHTMDPERWRGKVSALQVRSNEEDPDARGLWGKIVFPSQEAAKAVLDNPDLGVSARIRPNVQRSDGSTVPAGLIHVLGTLDPQVSGMKPWQATDLSNNEDEILDLSEEEYDMPMKKSLEEMTAADIDAMDDDAVDALLVEMGLDPADFEVEETTDEEDEPGLGENTTKRELEEASLSNSGSADLDLARQETASARSETRALARRVAEAEWKSTRDEYLSAGVPPHALDLAAPVLNRSDDMVIDLSTVGDEDVNVSEAVRGLLDALKGTVDLSAEEGHFGLHSGDDNPDTEILARWTPGE